MTLVYSGQISMGNIGDEQLRSRSNLSLRTMSAQAGFGTPDGMSEFYGYTYARYAFQHATQLFGPNSSTASGNLVTYASNVVITLTTFGGTATGATAYGTYFINGLITMRTPASGSAGQYSTLSTTYTVATAGSRSATLGHYPSTQSGSSSSYSKVTAA